MPGQWAEWPWLADVMPSPAAVSYVLGGPVLTVLPSTAADGGGAAALCLEVELGQQKVHISVTTEFAQGSLQ